MEFNVTFMKKPDEGVSRGNAFILDPDGYWIGKPNFDCHSLNLIIKSHVLLQK